MKTYYLFIFFYLNYIFLTSITQNQKKYYFYFDSTNQNICKYLDRNNKIEPVKYFYSLNTENLIFTSKYKNVKRLKLSQQDTAKLNVKNHVWLNQFTNIERDSILYRESNNSFYIIEKDSIDKNLYLSEVIPTVEIN
ncbi:hypothetical protein [Joostella sp. CR20]|uniref:hypothetical protein n=1 Tax=Joostella sp. CR20 TaxID=2804312 RepID=UPI00313C49CA